MFNLLTLDFDNLIIFIISKLFVILMLKKWSLVFYSNPHIVSFLTFIFLMHLKCTLMYNSSHFIFSQTAKQLSQHHLLPKSIFIPNYSRCHLYHMLISMSTWICSIPLVHPSIYVPITTLF